MGTPNEFMPSASYGFQQATVSPYISQTTAPTPNFAQLSTLSNNVTADFNSNGFFADSPNYDTLPSFHQNFERSPYFNSSTFGHEKPQLDTRTTPYNTNASQNSIHWSPQDQFDPFSMLPHEISGDHLVGPSQMYGSTPDIPFTSNHVSLKSPECREKIPVIIPGNSGEPLIRNENRYISTSVRHDSPNAYVPESTVYANGVINHSNQNTVKIDQSQSVGANGTEADYNYHSYKSELTFSSPHAPVVKYVGKLSNAQFAVAEGTPLMVNDRLHTNSPLNQQNVSDFHNNNRSKPFLLRETAELGDVMRSTSLVDQKLSEFGDHSRLSPHTVVTNHVSSPNHCESPFLNLSHANAVPPANLPLVYGDTQDVGCHNVDENRVTSLYSKLPYTTSVIFNAENINTTVVSHSNQSSYPLYNTHNPSNHSTTNMNPGQLIENSISTHHIEGSTNFEMKTTNMGDDVKPSTSNNLVGYSSVIMRANREFRNENENNVSWGSSNSTAIDHRLSPFSEPNSGTQLAMSNQHQMPALNDQQNAYFGTSSRTVAPQIVENVTNEIPMSRENTASHLYDETLQHQMQEHLSQQYQYPTLSKPLGTNKTTARANPRKRKTPKSNPRVPKSSNMVVECSSSCPDSYSEPQPTPQSADANFVMDNSTNYDEHTLPDVFSAHSPHNYYPQSNMSNFSTSVFHNSFQPETVSSSPNEIPHTDSSPVSYQQIQEPVSSPMTLPSLSTQITEFSSSQTVLMNEPLADLTDVSQSFSSVACEETIDPAVEEYRTNVRVIVPNIEEEFQFLFDPMVPNYDRIDCDEADTKPKLFQKNVDFLNSYIRFLENNCESVERLTDSNPNIMKSWLRNKTSPCQSVKDDETVPHTSPVGQKSTELTSVEEKHNFENDPRYYPLPKTSEERHLSDTFSDEDVDRTKTKRRKNNQSDPVPGKQLVPVEMNMNSAIKKQIIMKEMKFCSEEEKNKFKNENESRKLSKLEVKIEKLKLKKRKELDLAKLCEESGKGTPIHSGKSVGRIMSSRKAKDEVQNKIKKAVETDDEENHDSDSSWSPQAYDEEENVFPRKSTRVCIVRLGKKSSRKGMKNGCSAVIKKTGNEVKGYENRNIDKFYIQKKQIVSKKYSLWRLNGSTLQKFEQRRKDGKQVFTSVSQFIKVSDARLSTAYEEVQVRITNKSKDCLTVELYDEMDIRTDEKIRDNFMSESLCYESQFAVYVQTLVSQALNSNFLGEIVRDNDTYFLDNMKVIDDVTTTYLNDLNSIMKWGSTTVDILVKTWPFVSIENKPNSSQGKYENISCSCCGETNASKTAIFYGQPYEFKTLLGSMTNIPNNIDKTADLCNGCAKKIQLFNKIWHQKYHLFVECAKCVSKKRSLYKNKVTTDILSELLADNVWLSKLFYEIRNTWLLIWTMVQKIRKR